MLNDPYFPPSLLLIACGASHAAESQSHVFHFLTGPALPAYASDVLLPIILDFLPLIEEVIIYTRSPLAFILILRLQLLGV